MGFVRKRENSSGSVARKKLYCNFPRIAQITKVGFVKVVFVLFVKLLKIVF